MAKRWRKADEAELLRRLGNVPHFKPSIVFVGAPITHGADATPPFAEREHLVAQRLTELTGTLHVVDGPVVRPEED